MKLIFGLGTNIFLRGVLVQKAHLEPLGLYSGEGEYLSPFEGIDATEQILIAYVHPANFSQLSADASPPDEQWLSRYETEASCITKFYRENYSRTVIVDAVGSINAPADLVTILKSRGFPDVELLPSERPTDASQTPMLDRYLAHELFYSQASDSDVPTLIACTQAISEDPPRDSTTSPVALTEVIKEKNSLGEELVSYRDQIVGLYEELEAVGTARSELELSASEKALEIAALNDALSEAHAEKTQLGICLDKSRAESEVLISENQNLERLLSAAHNAHISAEQDSETLRSQLTAAEQDRETLRSQLTAVEQDSETLRSQLNELESQLPEYEVNFATLVARAPLSVAPRRLFGRAVYMRNAGVQTGMTYEDIRRVISSSGLFDAEWYLREYPEVRRWKGAPIDHYLQRGAALGQNPSEGFETFSYLKINPDVIESGMNPLVHYVLHGQEEGRLCRLGHSIDAGVFES